MCYSYSNNKECLVVSAATGKLLLLYRFLNILILTLNSTESTSIFILYIYFPSSVKSWSKKMCKENNGFINQLKRTWNNSKDHEFYLYLLDHDLIP